MAYIATLYPVILAYLISNNNRQILKITFFSFLHTLLHTKKTSPDLRHESDVYYTYRCNDLISLHCGNVGSTDEVYIRIFCYTINNPDTDYNFKADSYAEQHLLSFNSSYNNILRDFMWTFLEDIVQLQPLREKSIV